MRQRDGLPLSAAVIFAVLCLCAGTAGASEPTPFEFSHPDRIRFDGRSLIIDGKPVFIYSGAIHYFRCPRELWQDRLRKLNGAGLNCVETYLAWNLHEPDEPASPDDVSKFRDLQQIGDFIQTARDLGLYVIIRPGPYICAEVDRGGLPGWLMKHRPEGVPSGQFLRGNSPVMLAWDRHWLTAAAKVVKPHLITNVPRGSTGVILWQLENEYDWTYAGFTSDVRADVLRSLAHASLDAGIDVPLFTCETMDAAFRRDGFLRSHVFNTTNKYPGFDAGPLIDAVEAVAAYQPETFRGVTELQGGWFSQVGGKLSEEQGHNAAQISHITLAAIERGCTYVNYYMFYGGSNFGRIAGRSMTQSYDYNAPLREWGAEQDRYSAVQAIGQMLIEHRDRLIHSDPAEVAIDGDHPDVSIYLRRSSDGSRFLFLRNANPSDSRSAAVKVRLAGESEQELRYSLGKFEAKVLYVPPEVSDLSGGEWLPKPVGRSDIRQVAASPVPVRIVSMAREEPSDNWLPVPAGGHLDSAGVFDQSYVHYRVKFDLTAGELQAPMALRVRCDGGGGVLAARINGTEVLSSADGVIPIGNLARQGANTAEILFENLGCPNFGPVIEQRQGIVQISLVPEATRPQSLEGWRMKLVGGNRTDLPEVQADFDDRDWKPVALTEHAAGVPEGGRAVYRATLPISRQQLAAGVALTFGAVREIGTLFVNGHRVGTTHDWLHPWTFDITGYLHEGNNSIAMLVSNSFGDGGLTEGCKVETAGRSLENLQLSPDTVVADALSADQHRHFLVHYRMEFALPLSAAAAAAPWKLHLDADANAFVTFNGHLMGRYWAAGPQRDIWLPECWLNFGPESKNVVELQARPTTDQPVGQIIKLAEVRLYTQALKETTP
jgi:hypothetical protein